MMDVDYGGGCAGEVDRMVCPYCKDPHGDIIEDYLAGNITCRDCGSVLETSYVTHEAEWREHTNDEGAPDLARAESSHDLLGNMHSTLVGQVPTGGRRASTVARTHAKISRSSAETRLTQNAKAVKELCDRVALPRATRQVALSFFAQMCDKTTIKRPAVAATAAACVYAACRRASQPRSIREIAAASSANQRRIGKAFLHVKRVLGLQLESATQADFAFRYADALGLPFSIASDAADICNQCTDALPSSRTPAAVSAVAVHVASRLCGEAAQARALTACAQAAKVSEQTAVAALRDLLSVWDRVVPHALLRKARERGVNTDKVLASLREG